MTIYNAMQLKAGAKVDKNRMFTLMQPRQFLPAKEKDDEWLAQCINWLEYQGMKQLRRNSKRLMKNYKLAKGIIDKSDYIVEEDNEMAGLIDILTKEDESALELKFYPIIPAIVNVLCNEFSKRSSKIVFRAVDDISYNEMLEAKRQMIEDVLLQQAQQKQSIKMMQMGMDSSTEEGQQMMDPQTLKTLPEIEAFFSKDYRSTIEEWATHQMKVDTERFRLQELEEMAFKDMLITDREFWHFKMGEDDYDIELWNPLLTFYHKSPETRYISNGNFVGKIEMMTVADVIDTLGWMMDGDQLESLESIYPIKAAGYVIPGMQNDGSFYDATKSHEWNTNMPSLAMRQYTTMYDPIGTGDAVDWILSESEDFQDFGNPHLLRVSTVYWKSQRKLGHLTKITSEGEIISDIVSEDYIVTDKPLYNTTIYKQKSKDNLLFGEDIEWIWINETWGGVKVGPNRPATYWGKQGNGSFDPIYLGLNGSKPGRIPFQFKGDLTLYGCKLPVEGAVFNDRNTKSLAFVDSLKPSQVGFNMVNNQIADILVDELGTVIVFDQNALPRHSMGEDWGKNNLAKAYVAMKNFQMLPLDTSITNTENALNFQHYQTLNLEQSNRLLSRIQLANYFKNQAYEVVGLNPQRMGQSLAQEQGQTATEVEVNMTASYAQTEHLFIQHSDNLMPRVHQMRTDLAQYYHSKKPSVRLQYITTSEEKVNFQLNGTDLLMRDFNIYCTTKTNTRALMDQLKQLAVTNNTMGASIYDLGRMLKADSLAEVTSVLKETEQKMLGQKQQEQTAQQQLEQQTIESQERMKQAEMQHESEENDKDRQKDILVAEIRAAQMGATQDINSNNQSDYEDSLARIEKTQQFQETMNFKREQEANKQGQTAQKLAIEREALATRNNIANKQLEIARTNKNKYDKPPAKKSK